MIEHPSLIKKKSDKSPFDLKVEEILENQKKRRQLLTEELHKLSELEERGEVLKMLEQTDMELDALEKKLLTLVIKKLEKL